MTKKIASAVLGLLAIWGCEDPGSKPVTPPKAICEDPAQVQMSSRFLNKHTGPEKVTGRLASLPSTQWASFDSASAFFGGKEFKAVFTVNRQMYLLTYANGQPVVTLLSHGDESLSAKAGSINSPLFSPDGKKIAFGGAEIGRPSFIQDAVAGETEGWRVPIDPKGRITADPHWLQKDGKTWIYFASQAGLIVYSSDCGAIPGGTYRAELTGDTSLGAFETTGIPGAYRGGISRDGEWAGTSYASTALYDNAADSTRLLAHVIIDGPSQQCNPSMNPFPAGSKHMDYMMILCFGGNNGAPGIYSTVAGPKTEYLHQNLWIQNKDSKMVWQAQRPDTAKYELWDKPEWSTHPRYATAVAMPKGSSNGDLWVVKIPDLADAPEDSLRQAEGYLRLGKGGFSRDTYSHLWVDPGN